MNDKNSALHDELIAGLKRMGLAGDGTVKLTPLTVDSVPPKVRTF